MAAKKGENAPSAKSGEAIVRFEEVSFEYGHNYPILDEVSFSVRRGMKVTLMGQNGAGKSTIFSLLTEERKPERGRILLSNGLTVAISRQVIPDRKSVV